VVLEAARDRVLPNLPVADREPPHPFLQRGNYIEGIVHLGVQLAEALAFIHTQGVHHRDLKPSNVLLSPEGKPMLLDFNLSADDKHTQQIFGGTWPYMSPEQLRAAPRKDHPGDPTVGDARSDIFSLGVLLYQLLAGEHPFGPLSLKPSPDEVVELMLDRQAKGVRPLRELNPGVGKALALAIERCLVYDSDKRPQNG